MVVQFAERVAIDNQILVRLQELLQHLVSSLCRRDGSTVVYDVSDSVKKLLLLCNRVLSEFLLLLDLQVDCFRLSDLLFALVFALAGLFLLSNNFGDITLVLVQTVQRVLGYNVNSLAGGPEAKTAYLYDKQRPVQ